MLLHMEKHLTNWQEVQYWQQTIGGLSLAEMLIFTSEEGVISLRNDSFLCFQHLVCCQLMHNFEHLPGFDIYSDKILKTQ